MNTSVKSYKAQAAVVRQVGGPFTIESIDVAAPRADEVLIKMVGVGICHTDLVCRDGFPVPLPIVLGHEGSGIVEAVGDKVKKLKAGDHVVLSFNSCQSCPNCAKSLPAYCYNFLANNFAGVRPADGTTPLAQSGTMMHGQFFGQSSFATYAIAREINTVVVDDKLPLEILGPLGCGIQTGAGAAVLSLNMQAGETLAVFGGGAVGLSALLGARAIDAGMVIVVEPNAERGKLALSLGATHVINPKETTDVLGKIKELSGGGVNYAIDTTGIPAVMGVAIETMLPHGTLALIGVPPPDTNLPANLMSMLVRGVSVKYITEGDADPQTFIPRMLAWYQAGKFPFDRLISKFKFEQINDAAHATETGAAIKPVLVF